ncbi:erythromycin esterase family protein [Allokutzneria sp. A3M-2-11 16]|uniref:erythromycin esterase family protein n=1 Tax=Allokutzneria sp. A3M-2-11 16 TaxID=2962043 RepID=UPI0020B6E0C9|nr:erythromycin esterase family protein [Allokutzneria sp. A3M-2-11 16]MCP3800237.1 erythromycin esterase family protein [Allokutzneria sp. A3M-2-11 16]
MTITEHALPVALDPAAAPDDLLPFAAAAGDAKIVALGASCRTARELSLFSHRILRFLVENRGFRSLALEGDDVASVYLDDYVRSGIGDPREVLAGARSFWRTEEILETVRWLRDYNEQHPHDPVRIAHQPLPHSESGDLERLLADNTIAWQERTGHKVVYWGGLAHTSVSSPATTMGGHLRERFGSDFVSVGLTFHHGDVLFPVPAPPTDFAEAAFDQVDLDAFYMVPPPSSPSRKTRLIGPLPEPDDHLFGRSLHEWFDAVFHVREATPIRLLS